jgi:hypothetical protein
VAWSRFSEEVKEHVLRVEVSQFKLGDIGEAQAHTPRFGKLCKEFEVKLQSRPSTVEEDAKDLCVVVREVGKTCHDRNLEEACVVRNRLGQRSGMTRDRRNANGG